MDSESGVHVRGGVSRAGGDQVDAMAFALQSLAAPAVLEHDELAHEAISAELVACTLGVRRRPELMLSAEQRAMASLERFNAQITAAMVRAGASMQRAADKLAKLMADTPQASR